MCMPLKYLKTLKGFILKCPSGDIIQFVRISYVGITCSLHIPSMISMLCLHSLLVKTIFLLFLFFLFQIQCNLKKKSTGILLFFMPKYTEVYTNGPKKQI